MATPYDSMYPSPWANLGVGIAQGLAGGVGSFAQSYQQARAQQEARAQQAAAAEAARRQAIALEAMRQGGADRRAAATNETRVATTKMAQAGEDARTTKKTDAGNERARLSREQREKLRKNELAAEIAKHYNSTLDPETEISKEWADAMEQAIANGDVDAVTQRYPEIRNQSAMRRRNREARRIQARKEGSLSLKDFADRLALTVAARGQQAITDRALKSGPMDFKSDPTAVELQRRTAAARAQWAAMPDKNSPEALQLADSIHEEVSKMAAEKGLDQEGYDALYNSLALPSR